MASVIADSVGRAAGIEIFGLPDHPVEGVRLDNIRIVNNGGGTEANATQMPRELAYGYPEPRGTMPSYGVFARHVKGLELANFNLGFKTNDFRPAIICADVNGLEIDNFKAQVADGAKASVLTDNVTGIVIRNSPVLEKLITAASSRRQ